MAEINEVKLNGKTILSTRSNTVTEDTLVQGETAQNKAGESIEGKLDPVDKDKAYLISDEIGDIDNADYMPFYDISEQKKKKTLFGSIIEKLKSVFAQKTDLKAHTFEVGTEIPENADLNDYIEEGSYVIHTDAIVQTIQHIPVQSQGKLIVYRNNKGANRVQTYLTTLPYGIYERTRYANGTWTDWKKVGMTDDFHYLLQPDTLHQITANEDLNDYTESGTYQCNHPNIATTLLNCPVTNSFKLVVDRAYVNSLSEITQRITCQNATQLDWYRTKTYNSSTWGAWKQLASTDDITPSTVGNGYAVGTVSGSAITATISGFKLRAGVIVAIRLSQRIPANATLNISNTGAKMIQVSTPMGIVDVRVEDFRQAGTYTLIYTGSTYLIVSYSFPTRTVPHSYVADTSGDIAVEASYDQNAFQIKYNLGLDKLVWNYYKNSAWRGDVELLDSLNGILATKSLTGIASLDDIPVNTIGSIEFTSASGLSPLESISIRAFFYTCFAPTSGCKVLTLTRFNPTYKNSSSKWERVNNGSGWTSYWIDYTPRGTFVGTCATSASAQAKVATVDDDFKLIKGVRIAIKYTYTNTYSNVTTAPITLNVNNTGAKNIWYNTTHSGAGNTGTFTTIYGFANLYYYYVYDGTYWVWDGRTADNNNTNYLRNDASSTLTTTIPFLYLKGTSIDTKQDNNGVTNIQFPAFAIQDKNGEVTTRLESIIETNGNVSTYMYARNYNKNTATYFLGGLKVIADKIGNLWYDITNPERFNVAIGHGYGVCGTAEATTAKTVAISYYKLVMHGYVTVKFTYNVPANATLNINSKGAKNIWFRGANITANIIKAGDLATFIYDGTRYQLVSNDRWGL